MLQIGHKLKKKQWRHNLPIWRHRQFFWRCFVFLVKFSYWFKFRGNWWHWSYGNFLLKGINQKSGNTEKSEFFLMSGDWGRSGIPNLTRISLIKCYYMLQNARVTASTVSELLRENQQGSKITLLTQTRVKI